jgi:hypothetical protein
LEERDAPCGGNKIVALNIFFREKEVKFLIGVRF